MDKTGGPAFPETRYAGNTNRHPSDQIPGMTLRDYFAAAALKGMLASDTAVGAIIAKYQNDEPEKASARMAYIFADAMIAARQSTSMEGGEG